MAEETTPDGEETEITEVVEETKVTPDDDWKAKARKHEKASKQAAQKLEKAEARLKKYEDANKSEKDRLEESKKAAEDRASKAEAELLRVRVAVKKNLPSELAERLRGDTEEELEEDAERLSELVKPGKPSVDTDAGKGKAASEAPTDPAALADRVSRDY